MSKTNISIDNNQVGGPIILKYDPGSKIQVNNNKAHSIEASSINETLPKEILEALGKIENTVIERSDGQMKELKTNSAQLRELALQRNPDKSKIEELLYKVIPFVAKNVINLIAVHFGITLIF